jgi:sugar phosphate isomerase/epimerase
MKGSPEERLKSCRAARENIRAAGLVLWSVHLPYGKGWDISVTDPRAQEQCLTAYRQVLELCRELRPQKAVIHPSAEPIAPEDRAARLAASRRSLELLSPEFHAAGIQLALENLPRTCLGNTSRELLSIAEGVPHLGLCLDTNHMLQESAPDFIREVGGRIVTIHASDYDKVNERHWMPGDGVNDWKAIADALRAAGYKGPFLYEAAKHKDGRPVPLTEYADFLGRLR